MRNIKLLAVIAAAFSTLISSAAIAECPANTSECGSDYCVPDGGDCCADFGRPDKYCAEGSHCTTGGCASNSSTGSSSGSSETGGECDSGEIRCGDGCMPSGGDCCADIGRPENYCKAGSHCTSSGCASDSSGSSSSGTGSLGSDPTGAHCPSGQTFCGSDSCMPIGADCCLNVGLDGYCPSGSHCVSSGCLDDSSSGSTSTGTGSGTSSSGTSGSGTIGAGTYDGSSYCSDEVTAGTCSRYKACSSGEQTWYVADGRRFNCNGNDCYAAAQQVANFCGQGSTGTGSPAGTTSSDDSLGCTVTAPPQNRTSLALFGAMAGLALSVRVMRRRKKSTSR